MPVVAIVNRKGGSGKSTLATHLAGYCANHGIPVMLGDVDRQQSTQAWLRLREAQHLKQRCSIVGWTVDPKNVLRVPPGITHVILDTPGGLQGFELARVVMFADAIVMPVCNSVFDRESAADCFAELMALPRVSTGRCKVAAIGMRLDARTRSAEVLKQWADRLQLPFIGVLRETQAYVRCVDQGLTLFDTPGPQVEADLAQWQPILKWLQPILQPVSPRSPEAAATRNLGARPSGPMPLGRPIDPVAGRAAADPEGSATLGSRPLATRPVVPRSVPPPRPLTAPRELVSRPMPLPRESVLTRETVAGEVSAPAPLGLDGTVAPPTLGARLGRLLGTLPLPGFLQRHP